MSHGLVPCGCFGSSSKYSELYNPGNQGPKAGNRYPAEWQSHCCRWSSGFELEAGGLKSVEEMQWLKGKNSVSTVNLVEFCGALAHTWKTLLNTKVIHLSVYSHHEWCSHSLKWKND